VTALGDVAQAEAIATYRAGERALRRHALLAHRAHDQAAVYEDLRLARAVGIELVRNARGDKPDEWERDRGPDLRFETSGPIDE